MITVYRLVKTARAAEAFTGEGARLFGGRWNQPGSRMVYTSQTRSLALLETLVHVDASLPLPSFSFCSVALEPDDIESLPPDSFAYRDDLTHTRGLGEAWLQASRHVALAVPSVIVPEEINYLINPAHPRFAQLLITPAHAFRFDQRLVPTSVTYPRVRARRTP